MPDASILVTLREDFSDRIERMRSAGGRFSKDLDELEAKAKLYDDRMDKLSESQATFTAKVTEASAALKQAQRAFNADPTEDNRKTFNDAAEDYGNLKTQLDSVTVAMKGVRTEYGNLNNDLRRIENNAYGSGEGGGMLSALAKSGLGAMLGRSVSGLAGAFIGSAFDTETGSTVSGVLGGAASGAAMGAMIDPLWGTLVGAVAGGISGLIESATQVFEQRDDAFKSYVQSQYEELTGAVSETLEAGSTVAGSREQTRLAFSQRFGSDEAADDYLERVRQFANETNYEYDDIVGYSKLLLNTYDPEEVFGVLQTLSDASAALNLGNSDVTTLISGLSRMRTTGKTTMEYLNFFSERGVDVYEALSRSTGADKSDIAEMVSGGEIAGADAAAAILDYINSEFGGLSERLAGTYDAMVNNLEDAKTNLDAVMGEAYNEARKPGIQEEQEFYQSEAMEDAYSMIGTWKASLDNLKEELTRDALNAVMGRGVSTNYLDDNGNLTEAGQRLQEMSEKYEQLLADYEAGNEDAGAKMGALLAKAQAIAINEYNASDGYRLELQSQIDLVDELQKDAALQDEYWNAGYTMRLKFTEGLLAAQRENSADALGPENSPYDTSAMYDYAGNEMSNEFDGPVMYDYAGNPMGSYADGLSRVPEDDYPALLHRDERVLTAAEARNYAAGRAGSVTVTVTGNDFNVRSDADVDAVAAAIAEKVAAARALM